MCTQKNCMEFFQGNNNFLLNSIYNNLFISCNNRVIKQRLSIILSDCVNSIIYDFENNKFPLILYIITGERCSCMSDQKVLSRYKSQVKFSLIKLIE